MEIITQPMVTNGERRLKWPRKVAIAPLPPLPLELIGGSSRKSDVSITLRGQNPAITCVWRWFIR
jgi:hypothetical protein